MKKIIFFAAFVMFGMASFAQSNADEIALLQSVYGMEKKQIVADHMKITDAEATAFWQIYDEYEVARKAIGTKRANGITDYAKNYTTLTNEKASELVNGAISLNNEFLKLQKSTFKKMAKAITPLRAAQFFQLETFLENVIRVELASQIPFVGEFDVKKSK
jgi:hypothetical protein